MLVKFLNELKEGRFFKCDLDSLRRIAGYGFKGKKATIVVDSMLRQISYYFEDNEEWAYKELSSTILHELIHEKGNWTPPEYDRIIIYESPVSDLVNLMFKILEE